MPSSEEETARIAARLKTERRNRIGSAADLATRFRDLAPGHIRDQLPHVRILERTIRGHESGEHVPGPRYKMLWSLALDIPQDRLFPTPESPQGPESAHMGTVNETGIPDIGDGDMRRRAALQLLATLGVSAGTLGAEPLRRLVDLALTAEPRGLDDWYLACVDHLHAMRTRPAAQAHEDLVIDQLALGRQLATAPPGDMTELRRVEAALALLRAHLLTRFGDHGGAIRWWRTARTAADATGDLDLQLMVRCEEAGIGLYGQRDLEAVLALTHTAERIAGDAPSFWKADLAGTRAKALSLLGQHEQAAQALNDYVGYGGPDARAGIFPTLWVYDQAHFAESWVYAGAGDEAAADQARQIVLAGPAGRRQGGASPYAINVHLHEALCTVVKGGIDRGVRQAATILDAVPTEYRTHLTTEVGHTILNAVPLDQRQRSAVRDYRHVLTTTAPKPALPPAS